MFNYIYSRVMSQYPRYQDADRNAIHVPIHASFFILNSSNRLDETQLGGGNVEGIDIGSKASKGLLGAIGAMVMLATKHFNPSVAVQLTG